MIRKLVVIALLVLGGITANAQENIKIKVFQEGQGLDAGLRVSLSQDVSFKFDSDGNVVVTSGDDTTPIGKAPIKNKTSMTVAFNSTELAHTLTVTDAGYTTIYSPFRIIVPSIPQQLEVYAPTFNNGRLQLNSNTRLAPGTVIPAGTGVIVKCYELDGSNFLKTTTNAPDNVTSALSGSVISLPASNFGTIYSLAKENGELGFYQYTGENTVAGKAFLELNSNAKCILFDFDGDATGIEKPDAVRSDAVFNLAGEKVGNDYKGVVIENGKKYLNK